jgi:uncharacterized UPF0160 family protein
VNISKIITHNGLFHADEVFAIALINVLNGNAVQVERKRDISTEEYQDPQIWVIDVGMQFNTELNNLDHHQNSHLEAACVLVLDHLLHTGYCSHELRAELLDQFITISHMDRNGFEDMNGFQVSSLIRSFNNLQNGFELAINVAESYIKAAQDNAEKSYASLEIWNRGIEVISGVRVCDEFPIHWKRYVTHEALFLVAPDMTGTKWNVHSADSSRFPLRSTGKEEFLHAGKFIAVFATKEEAIACAVHSATGIL